MSSKYCRNIMNCSLEISIVSSHSLVTSYSHRNRKIGGYNIGLHSRSDGLVGDFMGGRNYSRKTISKETTIRKEGLSFPLTIDSTIDSIGGNIDGVFIDNGFPRSVGDDSRCTHSQGSLAVLISLSVESRSSK